MKILLSLLLALGPRTVAVLDFENPTGERPPGRIGFGIAEMLRAELSRLPQFRVVERSFLNDVLKELKLGTSGYLEPGAAVRAGKLLGAESVIVGTYVKVEGQVRLLARSVDVETGVTRATASADGPYSDLFNLQRQLATKLSGSELEAATAATDVEAIESFSDGIYYLRNDLLDDAVAAFDRALQLEPAYADAQFYRGLVLEKQERWDEAIAMFKKALPHARPQRRVTWQWDAPVLNAKAKRGIMMGLDTSDLSFQRELFMRDGLASLEKRVIYTEKTGKTTTLFMLDLEHHNAKRVEIPTDKVPLDSLVVANDRLTLVPEGDFGPASVPGALGLYGVGAPDGNLWWHARLTNAGTQPPMIVTASPAILIFYRENGQLLAIDERSAEKRWDREGLALDPFEPLQSRPTRSNGDLVIAKTAKAIQAIRLADGRDAWTFEPESAVFSQLVTDGQVIVFEQDRRVSILDLDSGKVLQQISVSPYFDSLNVRGMGRVRLAAAAVQAGTLYFLSKTKELYAAGLTSGPPPRWHTPLNRKIETLRVNGGRIYAAGADTGELLILDEQTGAVNATVNMPAKKVMIEYAGSDAVVVSADKTIYGLDPLTGVTRWEYAADLEAKDVRYFKGIVITKTAATQLSALDAETGVLLWQHTGKRPPSIFLSETSFFIIDETGVKEYAIDVASARPTNLEILTHLAGALISTHDLRQAATAMDKGFQIDSHYAPLHAARARLETARGDAAAAAMDLAAVASLAVANSQTAAEAVEELKKRHSLLWYEALGTDVIGKPELIDGKLISAGRYMGGRREIHAAHADDGKTIWRQPLDRFGDIVLDRASGRAWYVTSAPDDAATVILYSLALDDGLRHELFRWPAASGVDRAAIAYARDRIFILTVSPDLAAGTHTIAIHGFTATGKLLWTNKHRVPASPIGLFGPRGELLEYAIGKELWTVLPADGSVVSQQSENTVILPEARHDEWSLSQRDRSLLLQIDPVSGKTIAEHQLLWPVSGFHVDGNIVYAFTTDRVAYAQRLGKE
jgi:outer membrane protein assembly factor BamB/TolB-like protein